jgi:hypothetical protein
MHLSSPSHFDRIIPAFRPMPQKTQSNQIARSASVIFNASPLSILALNPSVIESALNCTFKTDWTNSTGLGLLPLLYDIKAGDDHPADDKGNNDTRDQ